MVKKEGKMFLVFLLMAVVSLALVVWADSDSITAQVDGANYDPVVTDCAISDGNKTQNPVESNTQAILITMNVSDANGVGDLNNSLAKVELDDALTFTALFEAGATNTTCTAGDINTTARQYNCTVYMQYWYQHATNYSIQCSAGDKNDSVLVTKDAANAFDYTQLVASTVDGTTIDFGTITSGEFSTNVTDDNAPLNITNTGNTVLANVSITAANLTQTGKSDIDVGQFWADDDNGVAGAQQLSTSKLQITSVSVPLEDSTAGSNTDSVWVWFSVPALLQSGTYDSTSWTLWEEE